MADEAEFTEEEIRQRRDAAIRRFEYAAAAAQEAERCA